MDTLDGGRPILSIRDLHVRFGKGAAAVEAVRGFNLDLVPSEVVAIVGESGSGKSVTSLAIMGLLDKNAHVSGSVRFGEQELIGATDPVMSDIRGTGISMIFQDPMTSLNPVLRVGQQLEEAIGIHNSGMSRQSRRKRAIELLARVGISDPDRRIDQYPHEFSGGMRQRVVIAIAIANQPQVIIADEPTTALDVTVQAQVIETLKTAGSETGASILFITHDLGVVAGIADRVVVMYAGRPVEVGGVEEIFANPRMPYTRGLLESIPRLDSVRRSPLIPIPGSPPLPSSNSIGCPFSPRCAFSRDICESEEPALTAGVGGREVACHLDDEIGNFQTHDQISSSEGPEEIAEVHSPGQPPLLEVHDLSVKFRSKSRSFFSKQAGEVSAVDRIGLQINSGATLGLVGESGCGKTSASRAILNLVPEATGSVKLEGQEVLGLPFSEMRSVRARLQLVFQDASAAMDPRMEVAEIVAEPLRIHRLWDPETGPAQVSQMLERVGLAAEHGRRYPHELSGGQRQRVGIARALVLEPDVIILDEPVSALDVSVQAGIVNLLGELQRDLGVSYLLIAHDLAVVRHLSSTIAVMYMGRIIEEGTTDQVFETPAHPYTQALISAIPIPDPVKERSRKRVVLEGDLPSPENPPSGCRFRTRCPVFASVLSEQERSRCTDVQPELIPRSTDHPVACHYAQEMALL